MIEQKDKQQNNKKNADGYTEVYVWGGDHLGQLGLGHKYVGQNYTIPKICSYNLIISSISCGESHSAFVTIRGHIYTIGSNEQGRLGINNRAIRKSSSPCLVQELCNFYCLKIACGNSHTLALIDTGQVYSWGSGEFGALGNGDTQCQWSPYKIQLSQQSKQAIVQISAGARHSFIVNNFGNAFSFGSNDNGQLGIGKNQNNQEMVPVEVKLEHRINQIACGYQHTLFLTHMGKVFACGGNNYGQLGLGHKKNCLSPTLISGLDQNKISQIAAGQHSAAINKNGQLYIWGTGVFGQYLSPFRFTKIDNPVTDVSIGGFFGSATDSSGVVWTWGSNNNGELGVGDYQPRITPFQVDSLKGRQVVKISCGGCYVMGLGAVIIPENNNNNNQNEMKLVGKSKTRSDSSSIIHNNQNSEIFIKENKASSINELLENNEKKKQSLLQLTRFEDNLIETQMKREQQIHRRDHSFAKDSNLKSEYSSHGGNSLSQFGNEKNKRDKASVEKLRDIDNFEEKENRRRIMSHTPGANFPNMNSFIKPQPARVHGDKNFDDPLERAIYEYSTIIDQNKEALLKQLSNLEESLENERKQKFECQQQISLLQQQLSKVKKGQGGIEQLSHSLSSMNSQYEDVQGKYQSLTIKNSQLTNELKETRTELEKCSNKLAEKNSKSQMLQDQIGLKYRENEILEQHIKQLDSTLLQKTREIDRLDFEQQKESESYQIKQLSYNDEIQRLTDIIESLSENFKEAKDANRAFDNQLNDVQRELAQLQEIKVSYENQLHEISRENEQIRNQFEKERGWRIRLEEMLKSEEILQSEYQVKIKDLLQENGQLNSHCKQKQTSEQDLQFKLKQFQQEIQNLQQQELLTNEQFMMEITAKQQQLDDALQRIQLLNSTLIDLETQNNKLVNLLNGQIEKQAVDYQQRTLKILNNEHVNHNNSAASGANNNIHNNSQNNISNLPNTKGRIGATREYDGQQVSQIINRHIEGNNRVIMGGRGFVPQKVLSPLYDENQAKTTIDRYQESRDTNLEVNQSGQTDDEKFENEIVGQRDSFIRNTDKFMETMNPQLSVLVGGAKDGNLYEIDHQRHIQSAQNSIVAQGSSNIENQSSLANMGQQFENKMEVNFQTFNNPTPEHSPYKNISNNEILMKKPPHSTSSQFNNYDRNEFSKPNSNVKSGQQFGSHSLVGNQNSDAFITEKERQNAQRKIFFNDQVSNEDSPIKFPPTRGIQSLQQTMTTDCDDLDEYSQLVYEQRKKFDGKQSQTEDNSQAIGFQYSKQNANPKLNEIDNQLKLSNKYNY